MEVKVTGHTLDEQGRVVSLVTLHRLSENSMAFDVNPERNLWNKKPR